MMWDESVKPNLLSKVFLAAVSCEEESTPDLHQVREAGLIHATWTNGY